jgi:hypothetical protein
MGRKSASQLQQLEHLLGWALSTWELSQFLYERGE